MTADNGVFISQSEAHRMAHSWWARKRNQSISMFYFWSRDFPDKEQIWQDMICLTKDKKNYIKQNVRSNLPNTFKKVVNKEKAWQDIHKLAIHEDLEVRCTAAYTLGHVFDQIPDKETAWGDLSRLIADSNLKVQIYAISAIGPAFEHIPNKEQAWKKLHQFTHVENNKLRSIATSELFYVLCDSSFKERAWKDLHRLTKDEDPLVRSRATDTLASSFYNIPDRELAWQDFHQILINDKNKHIRNYALILINLFFKQIQNKDLAWQDLHMLANDKDIKTRSNAIYSIISVFNNLTDKKSAWEDIYRATYVTKIKNDHKYGIVNEFGKLVEQIPDKNQLFKILHKFAKEKESNVKDAVAYSSYILAKYYIEQKDFKMAYECFDLASSALKGGFLKPLDFQFNSYKAFSFYYHGRFLVSKLPDIKEPEEYVKNIKNAVSFFNKAIKYGQKHVTFYHKEEETFCFPICLNIYSALYEYNLSLLELDEKRVAKIKIHLDEASKQCKVVGREKGIQIVKIIEKLSEALSECIEEVKLESKKQDASEKGKGKGFNARYITFIEKSRKDTENRFTEIDDLLNQLEAPIFNKIAIIEKENLKNLRPKERETELLLPKSFQQRSYEFIGAIWKYIVIIIGILAGIVTILK